MPNNMMNISILTDAGKGIGFGHLSRCTSLCQAFEEKGIRPDIILNSDESSCALPNSNVRLLNWHNNKKELFSVIDRADIAIVDSYLEDGEFYDHIASHVRVPVYIDDAKRLNYPKGIVINGAIGAEKIGYPKTAGVNYLLGVNYVPLRKVFWSVPEKSISNSINRILITFGGDDTRNLTPLVLAFMKSEFPNIAKNVVVGNGFKNIKDIEALKDDNVRLIYYPGPEEMLRLMSESDLAISAGGQTLYELARVGVPTIALKAVDNQQVNIAGWRSVGFIEDIGSWDGPEIIGKLSKALRLLMSPEARSGRCKIGQALVDGNGARRIVKSLLNN